MANDGGLHGAVQLFHEGIGCGVVRGRPAEVDVTHIRQAVKDCDSNWRLWPVVIFLWTPKACYPAREQGTRHCLCCDVREREGFRTARETIYSREAV